MNQKEKSSSKESSLLNKVKTYSFIIFVSILSALIIGELFLALFNPQAYIHPKHDFSENYRQLPFPNVKMEHSIPPDNVRHYTTNAYGHRGAYIPIAKQYDLPNIVLMGDSFTFGVGVNDGDEWGSVLSRKLNGEYNIINTGVGGWGLGQQIRRYYEFGELFKPQIVIVLFCLNDPHDNFVAFCTRINENGFEFVDFPKNDNLTAYWFSKFLGKSFLLKSNLISFFRSKRGEILDNKAFEKNHSDKSRTKKTLSEERFYNDLFNLFSKDLHEKGIQILFTSVNNYSEGQIISQLDSFPRIKNNIQRLDSLDIIHYINVDTSFTAKDMILAPDGHYDKEWNLKLATELAEYIKFNKSD